MHISEAEIRNRYLTVSSEYNTTPLAVDDGWVEATREVGGSELEKVVQHLLKDGVFLDIGTGMGIAPRFVRQLGVRTISVDSLAAAGKSAIENVKLAGVEGYFCDVTREHIPLEEGTVDCVLFADVIEHLIHSPKPVLQEISRTLKPSGVCIATTPNATRLTVRLKVLMGYSNWANIDEYFDCDFHPGHHHEYTIQEYSNWANIEEYFACDFPAGHHPESTIEEFKAVFSKSGFDVADFVLYEDNLRNVKIEGRGDLKTQDRSRTKRESEPLLAMAGKRLLLSLTTLFPQLRSNMLLVARKPA